mmetsp:Transcript_24349/g.78229  ORF Transcript_24349/g.78229 Transcript_24349/m.78229 type:complete len:204 (-) Transcript_24349:523-1134(-)
MASRNSPMSPPGVPMTAYVARPSMQEKKCLVRSLNGIFSGNCSATLVETWGKRVLVISPSPVYSPRCSATSSVNVCSERSSSGSSSASPGSASLRTNTVVTGQAHLGGGGAPPMKREGSICSGGTAEATCVFHGRCPGPCMLGTAPGPRLGNASSGSGASVCCRSTTLTCSYDGWCRLGGASSTTSEMSLEPHGNLGPHPVQP